MKMGSDLGSARHPPEDPRLDLRESKGRANFITLALPDLLPDRTGSVVIQTGGDILVVELTDHPALIRRGIAPEGTCCEHFNVAGMDYCLFANGTTLYFAAGEVRLLLAPK